MRPIDELSRLCRTPVRVHWSLALFPLLLLALDALGARDARSLGEEARYAAFIFGSIALHEIGHVVAAWWLGIRTRAITLHLIGGHAQLERLPANGREELIVVLAGPAVNLAIAAALLALFFVGAIPSGSMATEIAVLNLAIAIFNMLPLFPLDGGRALRAALSFRMGHVRATTFAASVGVLSATTLMAFSLHIAAPVVTLIALVFAFTSYVEGKAVAQAFAAPAASAGRGPEPCLGHSTP